jgi:hypothetical protein
MSARHELRDRRPLVGLRYTIHDKEFMSRESIDKEIEHSFRINNPDYVMAELFSRFRDASSVLKVDSVLTDSIPVRYDHIFIGMDTACEFDNPAIVT